MANPQSWEEACERIDERCMVYLDDMVNWRASLNTMFDDYKTLFPFMRGKSVGIQPYAARFYGWIA